MKVSPARRAAFEILRRVEAEGAYSSVLLAATDETLNSKDRALVHELVLGVLRHRLWLDRSLEYFASRKGEKLDLPVALALRIGLYQLRFLTRVPASAAVNESVNLVRASRVKSASSFVNAVLRRATREAEYDPAANLSDDVERLAVEASHPRWLIERWCSQFGAEETAALARANNHPAAVAFRFTSKVFGEAETVRQRILADLRAGGVDLMVSGIAHGAWRVGPRTNRHSGGNEADVSQTERARRADRETLMGNALLRQLSDEGKIYFQDEASQLVAQLLDVQDDMRVLDVCAAPGSKATLIAALAPHASVVAGDFYEHRVQTIKALAQQQGAETIQLVVHDARRGLPCAEASFDRVLVDAPCSGTGTLRHSPEIRWRLQAADIADLSARQKQILGTAARMVRPGGLLVYSTCSVETDENENVIADFLTDYQDFARAPLKSPKSLPTAVGDVRTWPQRDDVDGFFVAALRRRSN